MSGVFSLCSIKRKVLYNSLTTSIKISSVGRNSENKSNMICLVTFQFSQIQGVARMDTETNILNINKTSLKIVFTGNYVNMVNLKLTSLNLDLFLQTLQGWCAVEPSVWSCTDNGLTSNQTKIFCIYVSLCLIGFLKNIILHPIG